MVWKSWGAALLLPAAIALLAAAPPLCSGDADVDVSFSSAPRRVSGSPSADFAFRVTRTGAGAAGGGPCGDCTVTCQLDGGTASSCGNTGGNGTATVRYAGLEDGNHTLAVCASRGAPTPSSPTCATYAWDVG